MNYFNCLNCKNKIKISSSYLYYILCNNPCCTSKTDVTIQHDGNISNINGNVYFNNIKYYVEFYSKNKIFMIFRCKDRKVIYSKYIELECIDITQEFVFQCLKTLILI